MGNCSIDQSAQPPTPHCCPDICVFSLRPTLIGASEWPARVTYPERTGFPGGATGDEPDNNLHSVQEPRRRTDGRPDGHRGGKWGVGTAAAPTALFGPSRRLVNEDLRYA